MRKLWILVLLVPFVALWAYGCDETPTEPTAGNAATTAQGSSAPTFKAVDKPPSLPTPVMLSGIVIVEVTRSVTITGPSASFQYALCPEGKEPVTGGIEFTEWASTEIKVISDRPYVSPDGLSGWKGGFKITGTGSVDITATVVCADASRG
jgi:hypothetical protein